MTDLAQTLQSVFGPDGWLVRRGGRHLPEQLEYAQAVTRWLSGNDAQPVGLFEGDTGTGKTLGYLFPMILHWVSTGERSVVATQTVALQKQLLDGELSIVEEYLLEHGLPLPTVQQRLGMRHYVDPHRAASLLDGNDGADQIPLFVEWAIHSAEHGSGLLDEWTEQYGPLPEGVTPSMVCLTSLSPANANRAFARAKADSRTADIVITSHMMVLLEARSSRPILGLAEDGIRHLMLDEADQVPVEAEPLSNRRLQIREIIRQLQDLVGRGSSGLDRHLLTGIQALRGVDQTLSNVGSGLSASELILDGAQQVPEMVANSLSGLQAEAGNLKDRIARSTLHRQENDQHAQDALSLLNWVAGFNSDTVGDRTVHALAWSPALSIPSLMLHQANPALFVSRLWRNMGLRVGLTSATLGATQKKDGQALFIPLKAALGIGAGSIAEEVQLSPRSFGELTITLPDPSVPKPIRRHHDDQGAQLSERWMTYTARMVAEAAESGPTLVLTTSYRETEQLGRRLANLSPIVHRYGHPLSDAVARMQSGSSPILITPAAWQGSSIRGLEGGQLIRNLVITRIPFIPPNASAERLAAHLAEAEGRISPAKAISHERIKVRNRTLIKLRQGIGRLIRQQCDSGHLWLCDPRFPRPGETSANRFFVGAIPVRFHDAYREATLFAMDGLHAPAQKPAPTIVSEMLNL